MQRTCGKCGHINPNASRAVEAACPQCEAVYWKTEAGIPQVGEWKSMPANAASPQSAVAPSLATAKPMGGVEKVFWALTILGGLAGAVFVLIVENSAKGAPQEAAGAALALAMTVIPYCIARAIQQYRRG